jgi:hypothetical protein
VPVLWGGASRVFCLSFRRGRARRAGDPRVRGRRHGATRLILSVSRRDVLSLSVIAAWHIMPLDPRSLAQPSDSAVHGTFIRFL